MREKEYDWEVTWLCNECGELFEAPETCGHCPICESIDIEEQ